MNCQKKLIHLKIKICIRILNNMKFNNWIEDINRIFIPRPTKEVNKRFDMSERTIDFSDKFFNRFMDTITQEDIITYPSYADYENLKPPTEPTFDPNVPGLITNTDSDAYARYMSRKAKQAEKEDELRNVVREINTIKAEMFEIKNLLKEKLNGR